MTLRRGIGGKMARSGLGKCDLDGAQKQKWQDPFYLTERQRSFGVSPNTTKNPANESACNQRIASFYQPEIEKSL